MTQNPVTDNADDADLPTHWSDSAAETWNAVTEEREDLTAPEMASLWTACELISSAEVLEQAARERLYVKGSQAQDVLNPAAAESRQARTAVASILARLTVPSTSNGAMTNSQRGAMAARARWSR